MALGEVLVGKLADETDIFLDGLPFLTHLLDAVLAALLLQPLQDVLVLLDYLHQFPLTVGLVQRFLLILAQVLVQPRVGSLAALRLYSLDLLQERLVLAVHLNVPHLLQRDLLGTLVQELEAFWPLLAHAALEAVQLGLVDLPGSFYLLVEAQLVAHRDRSEHCLYMEK